MNSYSTSWRGLLGMHTNFWAKIKATWGPWQLYLCCWGCDPTMSFFTPLNIRTCKQQLLKECILAWALPPNPIWDSVSLHWRQSQSKPGLLKILVCSFTPGMLLQGAVHFLLQYLKAFFFNLFSFKAHLIKFPLPTPPCEDEKSYCPHFSAGETQTWKAKLKAAFLNIHREALAESWKEPGSPRLEGLWF